MLLAQFLHQHCETVFKGMKMSKKWRLKQFEITGILLLSLVSVSTAANTEYQDAESLKSSVRQAKLENIGGYAYSNIEVSVRSIDKRLRLTKCDSELSASVTNPTQRLGRVTTEVLCEGSSPWKIYVQATATAEMEIPVLVRALSRGSIIGSTDVQLLPVPVGQQQQPIAETIESLVGMELRRPIASGQPVLLSQITAPDVIKRGQQVNIRYDENDLRITMSGKALQNGAMGEWISVENASSGRQIEGRIGRDGSIVIPGM